MKQEWYCVNDFDDFVNSARRLVFKFFGSVEDLEQDETPLSSLADMSKEDLEELEDTLSFSESVLIVKNHAKQRINKKTKLIKYFINDKILAAIIDELNSRMVSNILNKLVNKGILDSAYDSEIDDFVFWVVEESDKEKPETD